MPQWIQKLSSALLNPDFSGNPDSPCRVIVEMATSQTQRIASYVEATEGKVHRRMKKMSLISVEVPYSSIQWLVMSPHVRKIWLDSKVKTLLNTAVPTVGGSKVQELGYTGKGVTVAVIDTGIYPHRDLIYPQNRIIAWNDLLYERPIPYDDNGHGTHVSGIIAGNGVSSRGEYVGMAPEASLVGIKALDQDGSGNTSDVISALEWCIENQKAYNIKVINLSIGATAQDSYREDPLCRAVTAAWNNGIVVCIAAGNDGPEAGTINTPGINPHVITVGNLDDRSTDDVNDDIISESSSRGPTIDNLIKPDLLAPGTNIMSLRPGRGYRPLSGTSMATPMVSGAVAQILQKWPSLKPEQVKSRLKKNARDLGLEATYAGSGALQIGQMFEEPQNEGSSRKSLFNILFGRNPLFDKRYRQKTAAAEPVSNEAHPQNLSQRLPLLPLFMLLPLVLGL